MQFSEFRELANREFEDLIALTFRHRDSAKCVEDAVCLSEIYSKLYILHRTIIGYIQMTEKNVLEVVAEAVAKGVSHGDRLG